MSNCVRISNDSLSKDLKMNVLYVTSDRPGAGKTLFISSVIDQLKRQHRPVGYFKPISTDSMSAGETMLMEEQSLEGYMTDVAMPSATGLQEAYESSPLELAEKLKRELDPIGRSLELLIVEGPSLYTDQGDLSSLSMQLVDQLNAKVIVVVDYDHPLDKDKLMGISEAFGQSLVGLMVNSVSVYRINETRTALEQLVGVEKPMFLGCIPEDRFLMSVTVGELVDKLNGEWISGEDKTDKLVESFLIGGNIMDHGETYFGQADDKAVIVRGDRPDIQLAAMATSTVCLILTGGHRPSEYVCYEADRTGVALIVVPNGTLRTSEDLYKAFDRVDIPHRRKRERFQELLKSYAGLEKFDELCG